MTIWTINFEYTFEGQDMWRPNSAMHLGDDDGDKAVNYVRERMVGSEVEVHAGNEVTSTKISNWRLTGLQRTGRLHTIDLSVLATPAFLEALVSAGYATKDEEKAAIPPCIANS